MTFEDQIITAAVVQKLEGRGYNDDIHSVKKFLAPIVRSDVCLGRISSL